MADDTVVVHSYFNPPSSRGLVCGPSMTHPEFASECDINRIMDRALKTGMLPTRGDMGRYGDFSDGIDYHAAQNLIIKADAQFASLPSKVRERFDNSASKFLSFIHDPKTTLESLNDLGILNDEAKAKLEASKAPPSPAPGAP